MTTRGTARGWCTPEYQHLAAMVSESVHDGSGVSGFPGHSEESWRRICLSLSRRQSQRHCAHVRAVQQHQLAPGLLCTRARFACALKCSIVPGSTCAKRGAFQHTRRGASCRTRPSDLILSESHQVHVRSSTLSRAGHGHGRGCLVRRQAGTKPTPSVMTCSGRCRCRR